MRNRNQRHSVEKQVLSFFMMKRALEQGKARAAAPISVEGCAAGEAIRARRGGNLQRVSEPLVSIITVVRNGAATLERAIVSVLSQTFGQYEYLIVDGGSTDGSIGIIEKYDRYITTWISETDSGIYDAMNKGILLARGRWIYFLGADDFLVDADVIESVALDRDLDAKMIFGDVVTDKGKVFRSRFGWRTLLHNTIHHQSAFYRTELFRNFRYNTLIPVVSDYELNLRIFLDKMQVRRVNRVIAHCASTGVSQTGSDYRNFRDYFLIRSRYIGFWKNFLLFGIVLVALVKKRVLTAFSRA